jgi:hypothetical protein
MKLTTYVDYCLKVTKQASMEEAAKAASALMKSLHAGFSEHTSKQFVLAFPYAESKSPQKKLSVFRVFSSSFEDQALLNSFVANSPHNEVLFYAKFPQSVPADFDGEHKAYTRFRIASRSAPEKRYRRMIEVAEHGNMWIDMSSKENTSRFRMYINVIDGQPTESGMVNGYGLSNCNSPVFVPVI